MSPGKRTTTKVPYLDSHRRQVGAVDGLERVLDLVDAALGREDGDMAIEAGRRTARHDEKEERVRKRGEPREGSQRMRERVPEKTQTC